MTAKEPASNLAAEVDAVVRERDRLAAAVARARGFVLYVKQHAKGEEMRRRAEAVLAALYQATEGET